MAGLSKPKVYTGVSAAISVADSTGVMHRVAYATGFTLDLSANTEDFNVLGQRYQESIPTYNNWTASSDAKANFENKGQSLLLVAYQNQDFVLVEFIINNATGTNANAFTKAYGYASIESLSIDAGEGVTGFSISLKGSGNLGFQMPTYVDVSSVTLNKSTLAIGVNSSEQLVVDVAPSNASENSVTWSSSDPTVAKVDELGFVFGVATGTATITATSDADSTKSDTCTVTVGTP